MSQDHESFAGWSRRVRQSIEIDAAVARVFDEWNRVEELPRRIDGVEHTKRINERRTLWDANVFGRQVLWESEVVECVPDRRVRWESSRGAPNAGEVSFEALPGDRTLMTVEVCYRPRSFLERLGARLGLLRLRIRLDLAQFSHSVEKLPPKTNDR